MKHLIVAALAAAAIGFAVPAIASTPSPLKSPVASSTAFGTHVQNNVVPRMTVAQEKQENGTSAEPSSESSDHSTAEPTQQEENGAAQPEQQKQNGTAEPEQQNEESK